MGGTSCTSNWTPTIPVLLKDWGLHQYAENFEREDMDIEALLAVEPTNNSLTESRIPLEGKRAIFLKKLKEFQLLNSVINISTSFYEEESGFEKQINYCEKEDNIFAEINENY